MTLPASGVISLSQVNVELGLSATASISLGDSAVRGLAEVASGAISLSDLYGKTRKFAFTISTDVANANLRTLAVAAGWDQTIPVVATIASGVFVYSSSVGLYALTIDGSWPSGVTLINNGVIVGRGGNAGNGGNGGGGGGGASGGPALFVSSVSSIDNTNGIIGGGGGGGGGGAWGRITWVSSSGRNYASAAGGGGGGGGIGGASGGAAGPNGSITGSSTGGTPQGGTPTPAYAGSASGLGYNGGGGAGATALGTFTRVVGGNGGSGGSYGAVGATGGASYRSGGNARVEYLYNGGGGGAGGACLSGNANITWLNIGARYGAIT